MTATLLLGIGNVLLSDEGAGVHALRLLRDRHGEREGLRYVDGGTLSFTLLEEIEDADWLIVFDAAKLDLAPGGWRCLEGAEMDTFLLSGRGSVHEVGLADLCAAARLLGRLPKRRALIGIQPATFGWGEQPSPAVAAALPRAADAAIELMYGWHRDRLDALPDFKSQAAPRRHRAAKKSRAGAS